MKLLLRKTEILQIIPHKNVALRIEKQGVKEKIQIKF